MNLPHQKPIKFAKKIIQKETNKAIVECSFPQLPTLAMLFEAAAQSSIVFNEDRQNIGYVVSVKQLELIQSINNQTLFIDITKSIEMGSICEFEFLVIDTTETIYAKGILVLKIEES